MADRGPAQQPRRLEPASSGQRAAGVLILSAVVAGGCGYLVTALASTSLAPEQYQRFGAYWSTLYLLVTALSGIQQVIARAVRPIPAEEPSGADRSASLWKFTLVCALITALVVAAFGVVFGRQLFGQQSPWIVVALVLGATGYVAVAAVGGMMFGFGFAREAATMSATDGIVRFALFAVAWGLAPTVPLFAIAVAVPFLIAWAVGWLVVRGRVTKRYELDVSPRTLGHHAWQTVIGAAASGAVLSGVPMLLGFVATDTTRTQIGVITLLVLLTRSPLVLPLLAVQGLLIGKFRESRERRRRLLRTLLVAGAGGGLLVTSLAALLLPQLVRVLFGPAFTVSWQLCAGLVASSVVVALMCISGPAAISGGQHGAYTLGWVIAAALTAAGLFVAWPSLQVGIVTAMLVGPLAGLGVHLLALRRT